MKRHQEILNKLQEDKYVEVVELCELLNVSAVTIRKDLQLLEDKGLLFRTHGGASLENPYIKDRPVVEKEKIYVTEKSSIASTGAQMVKTGDSIIIASGTTVQMLAKYLSAAKHLTVITSSVKVSEVLAGYEHIQTLQLGGYIRHSSSSVVGPLAMQILKEVSCNLLFLGADGIDLEHGLTTTNLEEAHLNREMMKSAERTILLADASKFGKRSFCKICDISEVDEVVTNGTLSKAVIDKMKEMEIKVTVVE